MAAADIVELSAEKPKAPLRLPQKRSKWTPKPRPVTRDQLDGRTKGAMLFDRMVKDIEAELGGDVSLIERGLIEGWVGASVGLQGLIAQLVQGKPVDWSIYAGTLSVMVRTAQRLHPWRRAKDITVPSLSQYLRQAEREDVS